ncbi:MAG: GreA/GreB family elongation factor [Alphaproteobacteria bacterium]|nr:GreA/GreB family elongation factor [Alphaproteobacteria bacterium]
MDLQAPLPDKARVVDALRERLRAELEAVERVAAMGRDEATSSESRAEGPYDTRATEASYLARGQALRVAQLRQQLAWFDVFDPRQPLAPRVVQVGALVGLDGPRRQLVFVAPVGGGRATVDGREVQVISPSSPLGAAMGELEDGDAFEVDSPRGVVEYEIIGII